MPIHFVLAHTAHTRTQLHAPPGGASSFSLGWGSEPAPAPVTHGIRREYHGGSDVFAAAAPPAAAYGGGAYGAAPPAAPSAMRMAGSDITNTAQQQYGAGPADPTAPPMGAPALGGAVTSSSNAYATGANQNCGAWAKRMVESGTEILLALQSAGRWRPKLAWCGAVAEHPPP